MRSVNLSRFQGVSRSAAVVLAFALAASSAAHAATLKWTLQDSFLEDSAQITGSFDYNAATNVYSNVDVSVSPDSDFTTSMTFTNPILPGVYTGPGSLDLLPNTYSGGDATGFEQLYFAYQTSLTNAGGTIPISNGAFSPRATNRG
ncbi:MAG TPA: hypothetical protein VGI95_15960 [Caulobacteraceae bacterium]|jgi:hypothetical protein